MNEKILLYPLWLRLWHWTNALLFLVLIVTGISMHYSSPANTILPFQWARLLHNTAGYLLTVAYLYFVIGNLLTPNGRQYVPTRGELADGVVRQLRYYLLGIFRGDPHPYDQSLSAKFNPLQKITYLGIMYVAAPVVIASGLLLVFPGILPDRIMNVTGILPVAVVHSAVGFFVSLFMVGHIYLASTGYTVAENYRAMITGFHFVHEHEHEPAEPEEESSPQTTESEAKHDEALQPPGAEALAADISPGSAGADRRIRGDTGDL